MPRSPKEKYESLKERDRNHHQIRCVAAARGDRELMGYVAEVEAAEEALLASPALADLDSSELG